MCASVHAAALLAHQSCAVVVTLLVQIGEIIQQCVCSDVFILFKCLT